MNYVIKAIFIVLLLIVSQQVLSASYSKKIDAANEKLPNIIFIVADDLGWQDVGFTGSQWFETPNLDQLASESLVFDNAYMYPMCSPSRAAMMTGQHSFRTGVYMVPVLERGTSENNIYSRWTVTHDSPMYSELLKQKGYKLSHIGKWHLVGPHPEQEKNYPFKKALKQPANGDFSWLNAHLGAEVQQYYPTGRGFDENIGGSFWGDPARGYSQGYRSQSGGYKPPFKNPFIEQKASDEWLTDRLTDEAIDFVTRHKSQPFFINLNFYAPHRPTVSRSDTLLRHFMDKAGDPKTGQGVTNDQAQKENIAAYATMIKSIDDNIKRLLDYLTVNNLRENTLIIFTSDNGFNSFQSVNKNLRGTKGSFYEGGIRVPMLVNWPKQIDAGQVDVAVTGLDYFPTFMELANIDSQSLVLDGNSLLAVFKGKKLAERSLIWHLPSAYKNQPATVIRRDSWKLIQYHLTDEIELYNLTSDLAEKHDVSGQQPKIVSQLLNELKQWRKVNKVPLPPNTVISDI
jgi:arylsulfatase A-like enzyme